MGDMWDLNDDGHIDGAEQYVRNEHMMGDEDGTSYNRNTSSPAVKLIGDILIIIGITLLLKALLN